MDFKYQDIQGGSPGESVAERIVLVLAQWHELQIGNLMTGVSKVA
jgi:hypothetical protein